MLACVVVWELFVYVQLQSIGFADRPYNHRLMAEV